jgi:hypothetical protein
MRYILLFLSFCLLLSCSDNSIQPSFVYDNLLFVREGGGSKVFSVYPTSSIDTFHITVTQYEFRDTTVQLFLAKDNTNSTTFDALTKTLYGQTQIVGDFKQSTLPTGTWSFLYLVKGSEQKEITNTSLRDVLSGFENIVNSKIRS